MQAQDIMTRAVITIGARDTIRHAAELMSTHRITSLPVLDEDDRLIGVVSEADVIQDRMPSDPRSHLRREAHAQPDPAQFVHQVMTQPVMCQPPHADTADVAAVMLENNVRAVPIVDGKTLLGIVSRRDLLRTLLRPDDGVALDVRYHVDQYSGGPGRWKVTVTDGVVSITGRFDDAAQERVVTGLARTVPGVLRVHTRSHSWASR